MNKTKEIKNKKINTRLYPLYKMISWDLLFYYSIIFLFLTQAKKFSASQVLLGEAFFTASCLILQIPVGILVDRIGKKKSLIFANICMCIFSFILIIVKSFNQLLIAYFIDAMGYVIKSVCETNILYDSLPKNEKRAKEFSKIDGKSMSLYFYFDAISAVLSGFLYVINRYLPLICCFVICVLSTILSCRFVEIKNENKTNSTRKYFKELKHFIKHMYKSKRLKYLMAFGGILSGIFSVLISLRSGILENINMPEQYFGIIFGILAVISGISARNQSRFHNKLKNKTLAILSVTVTLSLIIIGFIAKLNNISIIIIILLLYIIQSIMKGPFYTLIRKYLNNFTTTTSRDKISYIYNLLESLFRALILLFSSFLLDITDITNTTIIVGCVFTIIFITLLEKMRKTVGLKPENYKKSEIEFLELK